MCTLFPMYNLSLAAYAMPFSVGVTAYSPQLGDSCTGSIGYPPFAGFYGSCPGHWTRESPRLHTTNDAEITKAFADSGHAITVTGPSYGCCDGWPERPVPEPGVYGTPAVITLSLQGFRAVERPSGWSLVIGLAAPWLFLCAIRRPRFLWTRLIAQTLDTVRRRRTARLLPRS